MMQWRARRGDASWRLPGYAIEELIGAGSHGEVWRARVKSSGDRVALKRLELGDPDQLRAARSEAALLTALDHPNLVRLHRFVALPDAAVLVLDLGAAGSLGALLAARGRLTPGETITALAPIGAALAYAHRNGVVHGDVTPANILFSDRGLPLLADLGVARLVGSSAPVHSTPAYIDPAVAAGAVPGPGTDVFMLAASAVHALTGSPLWEAETSEHALALAAAADTSVVAGRLSAAGVAESTIAVVTRALAIEPPMRGTAADFALDLRHSGEPVAVELHAGRARRAPRHAARGTAAVSSTSSERAGRHAGDGALSAAGRPAFARPAPAAAGAAHNPELTHGARLPAPVLPRPRPLRSRVLLLGAACVSALLAVAAVLAWPAGGGTHHGGQATTRTLPHTSSPDSPKRAATVGTVGTAGTAGTPAAPSTTRAPTTTPARGQPAIVDALSRLDGLRARAFATRNPHLLSSVYVAGPLLERDTALLNSIVPRGCGLYGAHTVYRGVTVEARTPTAVDLIATATLSVSSLRCTGRASRPAPGAGPVTLHITLARHGSGYRISAQRR